MLMGYEVLRDLPLEDVKSKHQLQKQFKTIGR